MNIKSIFASIILVTSMAISTSVMAVNYETHNAVVNTVYVNTDGTLLFKVNNHSFTTPLNCTKNHWYLVDSADAFAKEAIYKQLLTAKLTGNTLWIRATGCDYYPKFNIVSLN